MTLTMMTKVMKKYIFAFLLLVPLACRRAEVPAGDLIRIGSVEAGVQVETKADAESVDWLAPLLRKGMDVTYGLDKDRTTAREMRLSLRSDDNPDRYSFLCKDSGMPGRWMGNGAHFFEGVYVPEALTEGADLVSDQRDYTQLSQYLSLPPAFTLNATVARIQLPLQHRLARVLAYILIDPALGDNVTIDGYTFPDDPLTSRIRFSNVSVLSGVNEGKPQWAKARKVVPHFVEEKQDFVVFYNTQKKTYFYPADPEWASLEASLPAGYERYRYKTVPVYDLIVRPTYTSAKTVMYDEASKGNWSATNKIVFDVTLSNGLQYIREFVFDLDANHETIVYLRIGRKSVDYNSSGSELWTETVSHDDYYGADNPGGHNLSHAGSSWQRAYKAGTLDVAETDGEDYDGTQYVSEDAWKAMFAEAYKGGGHHGDYFILDRDMTLDAAELPENFVFTGHLDGQDHTLTFTGFGPGDVVFDGVDGTYEVTSEGEANVHKEKGIWVPTAGWRAELINTKFVLEEGTLLGSSVTGYVHNCPSVPDVTPGLPQYK